MTMHDATPRIVYFVGGPLDRQKRVVHSYQGHIPRTYKVPMVEGVSIRGPAVFEEVSYLVSRFSEANEDDVYVATVEGDPRLNNLISTLLKNYCNLNEDES